MARDEALKAMADAVVLLQGERDMIFESEDDGEGNLDAEAREILAEFDDVIGRLVAARQCFSGSRT